MVSQRRTPPPARRRIPMTGNETAPAKPTTERWVKFVATPDGRVGTQRGVPDCMLTRHSQPQAYGYHLAGSPESEAQRAAVADAVRA